MLQNDYLLAKIGVDTAENEPYVKSDALQRPGRFRAKEDRAEVRKPDASLAPWVLDHPALVDSARAVHGAAVHR